MIYLEAFWKYAVIMAPFFLLGLAVAGLIKSVLPEHFIKKHFSKGGVTQVFKAAVLGIPLPLCSCSVVPTSVTLKKAGASNATVSSFLISTPESGVDSILVTYALMGPFMAVVRPVAAFFSAMVAGLLQLAFNNNQEQEEKNFPAAPKSCCEKNGPELKKNGIKFHVLQSLRFACNDLMDDMAKWLILGMGIGALIDIYVPLELLASFNGPWGKIALLVIGIPIYVCASGSTPIAVSMIAKGMSPGGAIIFLLVGPATNISNILILKNYIGKKGVALNLFAISSVALAFSFAVDSIYFKWSLPLPGMIEAHQHAKESILIWENGVAFIFLLLIARSIIRQFNFKKFFKKNKTGCCSQ